MTPTTDILDIAVQHIADDGYNHIALEELRRRLAAIRGTRTETRLWEKADAFIDEVRYTLQYGPEELA